MAVPFTDPVLIFASVMVLILLAPILARTLRLPEIVGLIMAGIVVGPHGLGLLARDQTIELLGAVGLLYIMFLAGLEIDLNEVRRNKSHTLLFGLVTFAIPLGMGTALGYWVFGMAVPVAILLASMFSSHTLVTFPIVGKLGLSKTRAVTTTIGGTIITDTLALLLLAVIASATRGQLSTAFWVRLFAFMVVYVVGVIILVPLIGRWFFRTVTADENAQFVFVIALTFLTSWLAHVAGLEPIIGAFLAGITLNNLIPERSLLMTRIHFTGDAIFIPFFLISVGMLVDLSLLLAGTEAWVISIGMIVIALVSKLLAAWASARALGYRRDEGMLIYGLSVNQAAATLAAVLVGFNIGLFNESVITGTIMMIAVTCFVGPLVTQRAGRNVAVIEEQAQFDAASAPHRILIPLESRAGARELLDIAFLLREKSSHEPVYPLRVVSDGHNVEEGVAHSEKILADSVVRAASLGIPVTPLTTVDLNVTNGILRAATENRISAMVLGWNGEVSARTRTFGRHIDSVVDRTRKMVLVNRLVAPLSTAKRIVLMLPPLSEREIGFEEVIGTVKVLANQAGSSLLVLASAETVLAAREYIERSRPTVPTEFQSVGTWKGRVDTLLEPVLPSDWLMLMVARRGEVAWQPAFDRLPGRIAAARNEVNLTVIVAPAERWDVQQSTERVVDTSYVQSVFRKDRTVLRVNERQVGPLLKAALRREFGTDSAQALAGILVTIGSEEPVELAPDVALIHTHVAGVHDSVVYLIVSESPVEVPLASGHPHIIVVLLDPIGQDPARHLRALADIARIVRMPDMVTVFREARRFEDIARAIDERKR